MKKQKEFQPSLQEVNASVDTSGNAHCLKRFSPSSGQHI